MKQRLTRGAGILLSVSSLPSPYGIGTFGKAAYEFVDWLKEAGQSYWQVLPLGPTSYGDSPYQSFSTFAGNPYFIDLDVLMEEGLLTKKEVEKIDWGQVEEDVDYSKIYENRFKILWKAFLKSEERTSTKYQKFIQENEEWLEDYALFMACKEHFEQKEWLKWEEDIRVRQPQALKYYKKILQEKIEFWKYIQYKFFEQWTKLKQYANEKQIKIIGDIPIYVALDSADVWANTSQYQLDEKLYPIDVAGCPPDIFSDYGQKWGNPLYDWEVMEKDKFSWWKRRMQAASTLYDVIRIDHFIGIAKYYAIPFGGKPADGKYHIGPGKKLTDAINEVLTNAQIIAEDLGVAMPEAKKLLKQCGYPGMKVLEFAFDGNPENEYLPHNCVQNCVVYTGTHDNETLMGYLNSMNKRSYKYLRTYVGGMKKKKVLENVLRFAYTSVADTVIIQMQDILEKDNTARMNFPSTIGENWRWRLKKNEATLEDCERLYQFADVSCRLSKEEYQRKREKKDAKRKTQCKVEKRDKGLHK